MGSVKFRTSQHNWARWPNSNQWARILTSKLVNKVDQQVRLRLGICSLRLTSHGCSEGELIQESESIKLF